MIGPHVPDLLSLQLLMTVEETGSLNAASAVLGFTQQAASARIRKAEAQVGVPLLVRTRQGSSLTPSGRLVARWAADVVSTAEQLDAGISSLRSDRQAQLRVAASLTIAEHLVPRWLVELRAAQHREGVPVTHVELTVVNSESVLKAVHTGAADLGFIESPDAPDGFSWRTVGRDELVVVVAPGHPWADRSRPVTGAELARTALVVRETGSGTRDALDRALTEWSVGRSGPAMELGSSAAVRTAILSGVAPGALSELALADDLTLGRLRAVKVRGVDLHRELRAVWLAGAEPPAGPSRALVALARRS
ncbi:LysR family transcriptional regulator [Nakamurella silvestris]|nr:LysR family transcriptional regulator [Nakamurella silvestris]